MAVDDEMQKLFDNEDVPEDIRAEISRTLADDAAKNQLIDDMNNYTPEVFLHYADLHNGIASYHSAPADNYGSGTLQAVSNLIAYSTARKINADFSDISYVEHTGALLDDRLAQITDKKKSLFLGEVNTENKDHSFNPDILKTILQSPEIAKYETVAMGLSLYNPDIKGRHEVSLILSPHKHEAMLIDQVGQVACPESKEQIRNLLGDNAYAISYEPDKAIMENRSDCAIFSAMINEKAVELGTDDLKTYVEEFSGKPQEEKAAAVDTRNKEYKNWAFEVYWDLYKENPLFKKYLEAQGVDINTATTEEKMKLLQTFNSGAEMTVEGKLPEEEKVNDPTWKDDVREAVAKANEQLSQEFEECPDEEHPDHIFFRDKNNAKNVIAFASKDKAYVAGEQNSFDELVVTAQKMGKKNITFGEFAEHPEYRAKLYLACLKYGMEMKNAPELESLKEYPEYAEIESLASGKAKNPKEEEKTEPEKTKASPEQIKEMREKFHTINADIRTASDELFSDKECLKLVKDLKTAQKDKKYKEADTIREQIKETPQGKKLHDLIEQKSQLIKNAIESGIMSKETVEQNATRKGAKYEQNKQETEEIFKTRKNDAIRGRKLNQEALKLAVRQGKER